MIDIIKHNVKFKNTPTKRKKTKYIVLHCTADPEGRENTVEQVHKTHLNRGFSGIGYNILIYRDGSIHEGRPLDCSGAHATNYNSISVGVSYVGGCEATKRSDGKHHSKDTRTTEQKESIFKVVQWLQEKYNLTDNDIRCHYQITVPKPNMKACPSFKLDVFLKEFREWKNKK